jgi:hypothetical protein
MTGNQSQSHIATDGQSVSLGVELGLMTRYLLPFVSYGLVFVGTSARTTQKTLLPTALLLLRASVAAFK